MCLYAYMPICLIIVFPTICLSLTFRVAIVPLALALALALAPALLLTLLLTLPLTSELEVSKLDSPTAVDVDTAAPHPPVGQPCMGSVDSRPMNQSQNVMAHAVL